MRKLIIVALFATALVPATRAEEDDPRILHVYDVRDFGAANLAALEIAKSIRSTLGEEQASVQLAENGAVIVRATPEIQKKVATHLAELRDRLLAVVLIEARIMHVAEGAWGRASGSFPKLLRVGDILKELEDLKDKEGIQVLSAPSIMVVDGQRGDVRIGSEVSAITDLNVKKTASGGVIVDPKMERTEDGIRLGLRPILSLDEKYITLVVEARIRGVARRDAADVAEQPIPGVNEMTESRLRTSVTLPTGSMALFDLGRRPGEPDSKRTLLLIGARKVELPGDLTGPDEEK